MPANRLSFDAPHSSWGVGALTQAEPASAKLSLLATRPRAAIAALSRGAQYADPVATTPDERLWKAGLHQQSCLGNERFVEGVQALAKPQNAVARDTLSVSRVSRLIARAEQAKGKA